jgi:preprotein translocase subunit SecB
MTDETTPGTPAQADPTAPVVQPQAIYIKDCSFESPNGPFLATAQGNPSPSVNLNLGTRATALAQDLHEVAAGKSRGQGRRPHRLAARVAAGGCLHDP